MHRFMYTLKYPSSVLDESSSCSICIVPVHAVAKWVPLWHRVLDTICIKEQISRTSTIAIDLASCQCGEKPTTSCQSVTHKTTPLDASYNLRFGLCEKKTYSSAWEQHLHESKAFRIASAPPERLQFGSVISLLILNPTQPTIKVTFKLQTFKIESGSTRLRPEKGVSFRKH